MAIQYPGGTIVNATFTGATKTNIVNNLETQLTNAGWSVISGTGTGDVIMESASTPTAANNIRVRLRDSLLTNCAAINMQNASASKVSQNYFLLPGAAKTFRVLANKYQFFIFTTSSPSTAREYVGCGVPYIPSFLHTVITGELGWIHGNGSSDTDTTVRQTFRTALSSSAQNNVYWSALCNANLVDSPVTNASRAGELGLIVPQYSRIELGAQLTAGYRWHDDTLQLADPLICWGLTAATDEAKIRGQLWGAMIATDTFTADQTLSSVDSHDWHGITNTNAGSVTQGAGTPRGTLFVITT